MSVDRRSINVLLSALDLEQRTLGEAMGYRAGYVANVLNGHTEPSAAFKQAFGELLADLLLGPARNGRETYPAGPLAELIRRSAPDKPYRERFYADLGTTPHGWNKRRRVRASVVDRICCALGVHPSELYPEFCRNGEPS